MSLLIHHFFSSSRINQCYQLLRYIYFFILSFIDYQLFLFVFKLLGTLLLKVKPKWPAQVAQGIIKEDLSTTM